MPRFFRLSLSVAALLTVFAVADADIPRLITYQGLLVDGGGNPVPDDVYQVIFSIYPDSTSRTAEWTETQLVTTSDGLFNVQLGLNTELDRTLSADYADLFVGLQLNGEAEMAPPVRGSPRVHSATGP